MNNPKKLWVSSQDVKKFWSPSTRC